MKKFNLFAPALGLVMLMMGCGMTFAQGSVNNGKESDATVSKTVRIKSFNKISACQGIKVVYTQGAATGEAKIRTTPSAEKYLKVTVDDGELKVRYEGSFKRLSGPSIVSVTAPELKEIDLSSAGAFDATGDVSFTGNLEVDLNSAASANFNNLKCNKLEVDASSSGHFNAKGVQAEKMNLDGSSASQIRMFKAVTPDLDADASSAAKIILGAFSGGNGDFEASSGSSVKVTDIVAGKVNAEASSGGNITLSGKCRSLSKESSSGGSVSVGKLRVDPSTPASGANQPRKL